MWGRDEPIKFFSIVYETVGLRNGKFITTGVYGKAVAFVTEEGFWQSFDANGQLFDDGKFLVLRKKVNKGWKIYKIFLAVTEIQIISKDSHYR